MSKRRQDEELKDQCLAKRVKPSKDPDVMRMRLAVTSGVKELRGLNPSSSNVGSGVTLEELLDEYTSSEVLNLVWILLVIFIAFEY